MSRHQAYRNYDYENDIEEYDGADDGYEEGEGDVISAEDKAQMEAATVEVRSSLGAQASKVTTAQIQESLWHTYYDVDKTIAFLITKFVDPPAPKAAKKAPVQTHVDAAFPAPLVRTGRNVYIIRAVKLSANQADGPVHTNRQHRSFVNFFHDMPWLDTPQDRQSGFIAPLYPRGGLLGGSGAPPRMSKLQALAEARKKKAAEQKAGRDAKENDKPPVQETIRQLGSMSLASKARQKDDTSAAASNSPVAEAMEPTTPSIPLKRKTSDAVQLDGPPTEAPIKSEDKAHGGVTPIEPAAPSDFAQALWGPSQHSHVPREYALPYMAHVSSVADAFSGPSPDDVVLTAQAKASNKKLASITRRKGGSDKVEQATNGMQAVKIDDAPLPKSKNLDVLSEYEKKKSKKSASFVVVGHVDAGKSTMMGRLLLDLNVVNQRTIDRYRKEAAALGKSSFALAWVLDQGAEERSRGVTVDIATNKFETESTSFTILDAPGHRDFIPNMIAGASQADFAILVVDASTGSFESGLKGQTREHALLLKSMGVSRVIVAVNKLDMVGWSQERFDEIRDQVSGFMKATGFLLKNISFVPVSGLNGDNIVNKSAASAANWYTGEPLIGELENSEPMSRSMDKPLRMTISEVYRTAQNPLTVSGRIDAGQLQTGDALLVQPAGEKAYIKSIELDMEPVDWAVAGQNAVLHLSHIDADHVRVGDIICDIKKPVNCIDTFTMKALAFDILVPGGIDVHRGRLFSEGLIVEMPAILDKVKGTVLRKKPNVVKPGNVARVTVKLNNKIPLEAGQRVVLRSNGQTIAAGLLE